MSNLDESDRNWLRTMLLTPIKCEGSKVLEIDDKDNVILTSDTRYCYHKGDPDMSDLAIEFYEILYGKKMLKDGHFRCDEFAGDTMNSFRSVANQFFDGSPKRCEKRKKAEENGELPPWLQEYFEGYHCLANFWAIPKAIGREVGNKGDRYDFAFSYIEKNLNNPDDPGFLDRHCVRCYTKIEDDDSNPQKCGERVIDKPDYKNPHKCVERVKELWKARAEEIIDSSKAEQLLECFKKLSSGESTC